MPTLSRVSCSSSGNGYITTQTLREILAALDDKLGPDDLDGIIAEIDTDGSGTVDFDGECRDIDPYRTFNTS
jgi:Ca2+-binding EF-hand superfamily protein